jgi:hypothetical protein
MKTFNTLLRKSITLSKQGRAMNWREGDELAVTPLSDFKAEVQNVHTGDIILFKIASLYKLSYDFVEPSAERCAEAMADDDCPSIAGASVEPDGHDEFGFPSILLVQGYI